VPTTGCALHRMRLRDEHNVQAWIGVMRSFHPHLHANSKIRSPEIRNMAYMPLLLLLCLLNFFHVQPCDEISMNVIKKRVIRKRHLPGGKLCLSFSAFSTSSSDKVYRYRVQRTLNFVLVLPPTMRGAIFFILASEKPR
jgi:hypothetical protein